MKTNQKLVDLVRAQGGDLRSPCSDSEIALAEGRLGFSLPESMRQFYKLTNGASIHENMWEFFSLDDLAMHHIYRHNAVATIQCRGGRTLRSQSLMIFADVMIDAPSYWLCVDPDEPEFQQVYCDGDTPWWRAANSYDEFVAKLMINTDDIFMGLDETTKEAE